MLDKPPSSIDLIAPMTSVLGSAAILLLGQERNWTRIVATFLFGVPAAYYAPPAIYAAAKYYKVVDLLPAGGSVEGLAGLLIGVSSIRLLELILAWLGTRARALEGGGNVPQ